LGLPDVEDEDDSYLGSLDLIMLSGRASFAKSGKLSKLR
jgi:hypothetical protein